jgi:hypothetical protein
VIRIGDACWHGDGLHAAAGARPPRTPAPGYISPLWAAAGVGGGPPLPPRPPPTTAYGNEPRSQATVPTQGSAGRRAA